MFDFSLQVMVNKNAMSMTTFKLRMSGVESKCSTNCAPKYYSVHRSKVQIGVVVQLEEQSLPISEVRSSNPVNGKFYIEHFTVNWIEKTKIKGKEAGNGP